MSKTLKNLEDAIKTVEEIRLILGRIQKAMKARQYYTAEKMLNELREKL